MITGQYRTTYQADEGIWSTWPKRYGLLAALIGLAIFPFLVGNYAIYMAAQIAIFLIAVVGLNVLIGYTGLLSLGHGAFFAVGAFTTVALHQEWPTIFPLLTLAISIATAAFFGVIFGLPALRVKGLYLVVATLSANFIVLFLIERDWVAPWTGGVHGTETPNAVFFGYEVASLQAKYFMIMPVAVLMLLFAQNLIRTRFGRALIAIRDRDYSAEIMGISLAGYKLKSFAISAGYCGAAGCLWAYFFPAILPEDFDLHLSILLVVSLVAGGMGRTLGPVFGTILILMVPEWLKGLGALITGGDAISQMVFSPLRDVVFGLIIIGFLIFEPMGLASIWDRFWRFMDRWPFAK